MKSLKRTLSLVLALVMVLGLFGGISMTAAASDFTDDESIQYKEAVDVMTAVGAINGMGDGTFQPKGTITRAQAAKLVTYAVLGKDTTEALPVVTSSFSDVTVAGGYDWAIPSIEYLVKQGVINGMGDGTFKPNDPINGYAVAKMLLCALGYGQKGEFTGNGWDLQVAIYGTKAKIFEDRDKGSIGLDKSATREEVALYCFNATCNTGMVEYLSTLDIYRPLTDSYGYDMYLCEVAFDAGTPNGLNRESASTTAFGEPATKWIYAGEEVGRYAKDTYLTYTSAQTKTALTKDLVGVTAAAASRSVDNGDATGAASWSANDPAATLADAIDDVTGNGVLVELFVNKTDKTLTDAVVIKSEIATIGAADGAGAITIKSDAASPLKVMYTVPKDSDLYKVVSGFKEDDRVIITPVSDGAGGYTLASVTAAESVTGKFTARVNGATHDGDTLTLDGETYKVAKVRSDAVDAQATNVEKDVTFWLDSYGYVVDITGEAAPASCTIYYVLETYSALEGNKVVDMMKAIGSDGETVDVPYSGSINAKDIVSVTKDASTGVWDCVAATAASGASASGAPANADTILDLSGSDSSTIDAKDRELKNSIFVSTSNYYNNLFASDIKFIYVEESSDYASVISVADGVQRITDAKTTTPATAIIENRKDTNGANQAVVTAFIVKGEPEGAIDSSKIVLAKTNIGEISLPRKDGKNNTLADYWSVYVNGEQQNIALTETPVAGKFYTLSESTTTVNAFKPNTLNIPSTNGGKIENGVLKAGGMGSNILVDSTYVSVTSDTTIVDTRTAAEKSALSIIPTAAGLQEAANNDDYEEGVTLSLIYDANGNATVLYILSSAKTVGLTVNPTSFVAGTGTSAGSNNTRAYTVAANKSRVAKDETFTLTITVGADASSEKATTDTFSFNITGGQAEIDTQTGLTGTDSTNAELKNDGTVEIKHGSVTDSKTIIITFKVTNIDDTISIVPSVVGS